VVYSFNFIRNFSSSIEKYAIEIDHAADPQMASSALSGCL
jgi:hypothetical protein